MLTSKELQYVDMWAYKTPMPGEEYSLRVMDNLKQSFNLYNKIYRDKEYNFIFSNGDERTLRILPCNLCHMLGIDYSNIKGDFFRQNRSNVLGLNDDFTSYDLLEALINNKEKVVQNDNNPSIRAKYLNYYKSQIKCEIFDKLSSFDQFNFGYIHQDDYEKSAGETIKSDIFYIPSNESVAEYFMMRITPDSNTPNSWAVSSLLAPPTKDLKKFFIGQEAAIPTQILISDNNNLKKMIASPEEKIKLLEMYKAIITKYRLPNLLNIMGDYASMLNDLSNEKVKQYHK